MDTGGPAFPHHVVCDKGWAETQMLQGMTLRDYFAAKAMQAIMAPNPVTGKYPQVSGFEACAVDAYEMADAMLKAREQ